MSGGLFLIFVTLLAVCSPEPSKKCLHNVFVARLPQNKEMTSLHAIASSFLHKVGHGLPYDQAKILFDKVVDGKTGEALDNAWQIAKSQGGFLVCLLIGILFVVGLPIAGIFVAINRCCCNTCGGKRYQESGTRGGCVFLTILLAICGTFWFASLALYVRNEARIFPQLPKMRNNTAEQIGGLERYVESVQSEIHCLAHSSISMVNKSVLEILDDLDQLIVDRALDILPLVELHKLAENCEKAIPKQEGARQQAKRVQPITNDLASETAAFYSDLMRSTFVWEAKDPGFADILKDTQKSLVTANLTCAGFIEISSNTTEGETTLTEKVPDQLNKTKSELEESAASTKIEALAKVFDTVASTSENADEQLAKIDEQIHAGIQQLEKGSEAIEQYLSDENLKKFSWAKHVLGILALPSLIILIFLILGCVAGSIGFQEKKPRNRGIVSHTGGLCVLTMAYSVFILVPIMVILIFALFFLGYATETYVCYPLLGKRNEQYMDLVTHALAKSLPNNVTLNVADLLSGCERNVGILSATGFKPPALSVPQIEVPPPKIDPPDTEAMKSGVQDLSRLLTAYLDLAARTTEAWQEAYKNTSEGLQTASKFLEENENKPNSTELAARLKKLKEELTHFEEVTGDATKQLEAAKDKTNDILDSAAKTIDKMDGLATAMTSLATDLANDVTHNVTDAVNTTIKGITEKFTNDLGKCLPVYRIWENTGSLLCHDILPDLNGLWFSLGIGLLVAIPTVAVGFLVSKYYLRMDDKHYKEI